MKIQQLGLKGVCVISIMMPLVLQAMENNITYDYEKKICHAVEDVLYPLKKSTVSVPLPQLLAFELEKNNERAEFAVSAEGMGDIHIASMIVRSLRKVADAAKIKETLELLTEDHKKGLQALVAKGNISALVTLFGAKEQKAVVDACAYGTLQGQTDAVVLWLEGKKSNLKQLVFSKPLIRNAEQFLDVLSKTACTANATIYYAQGFLSLLNIVVAEEKQPWKEFSNDVLNAISFFKKSLEVPQQLHKKELHSLICRLYSLLLNHTQDDKKKKQLLEQYIDFDPHNVNAQADRAFMILTNSHANVAKLEIARSHDFFNSHVNDGGFVKKNCDRYFQIGRIYGLGSQAKGILCDQKKGETYLRAAIPFLQQSNRIDYIEACFTLGQLLLDMQIKALSPGSKIPTAISDEISNYFLKVNAAQDPRGMFGFAILNYWQANYEQAIRYFENFYRKSINSLLYQQEFGLTCWCLGTMRLLGKTRQDVTDAYCLFKNAHLFEIPEVSDSYLWGFYLATPPHIVEKLHEWALQCNSDLEKIKPFDSEIMDEYQLHRVNVLYVISMLTAKLPKHEKDSLKWMVAAGEHGSRCALLYLGCLPQEKNILALHVRIFYLNLIAPLEVDDAIWKHAQAQIVFWAKFGCLDAQASVTINMAGSPQFNEWLQEVENSPLKAELMLDIVTYKSLAYHSLIESKVLEKIQTLADSGNTAALLILGNTEIAQENYKKGIPLLEKVYDKFCDTKNPAEKEFKKYLELLYVYYALHELRVGNLEFNLIEKAEHMKQAISLLNSKWLSECKLAHIVLGMMISCRLVNNSTIIELGNLKKNCDTVKYGEVLFYTSISSFAALTFLEKNIFAEFFVQLHDHLKKQSKKDILANCGRRILLLDQERQLRERSINPNSDLRNLKK